MKTDLCQSCGLCWVFQICWRIECRIFTVSSFRFWNSSTGIPSPPLALFVVMLPKANLFPGCLALGMWSHHRDYLGQEGLLYSSSIYSYHLFLISSASVRSMPFLSFIVPILGWNVPFVLLIFLKRPLIFSILLFPSTSLHWWLRKAFLSLLAVLWNSTFNGYIFSFFLCFLLLFFSQLFVRPSQTTILPSWISFSLVWFWVLPPVHCYELLSIVLQALCLPDLIPWIYLSPPLYNWKGFDFAHTLLMRLKRSMKKLA